MLNGPATITRSLRFAAPRLAPNRLNSFVHHQARHGTNGSRGARGHGWFVNYRAGKGGRHLQGEYFDRESLEECQDWNEDILKLGSTRLYMDVVVEAKSSETLAALPILKGHKRPTRTVVPPLDSLTGPKHRLIMDVASGVMPETVDNFVKLCTMEENGYKGTKIFRFERDVGLCAGDVLTNTGKTGLPAPHEPSPELEGDGPLAGKVNPLKRTIVNDPLVMWHLPGTITMVESRVHDIDSRFIFCTFRTMHMDGIHRAFGQLHPESLKICQEWQNKTHTQHAGVPSSYDFIITDCGLFEDAPPLETQAPLEEADAA